MRLLIGTRKGLFRLELRRDGWRLSEPRFRGVPVLNATRDPRDGSIWACVGHGHWGSKLHVSTDDLESFAERTCPAFPEGYEVDAVTEFGRQKRPASVSRLYTVVPRGPDGGRYLAGTDPGGLFETRDGGETWTIHDALWTLRNEHNWFEGGGGVMLHSILVDPRDPDRIHVGVSCGGVYETRDGGASWEPRNRGVRCDFLPDPDPVAGHDPHMLRRHARSPDVLWQQNHCGNWRSRDGGASWDEVTEGLPTDIGFALALDDEHDGTAWTVPMESDEVRIAPGAALSVWRTEDAGATWQALRDGLPQRDCYDIVFRHALDAMGDTVVFGTTCGRLFASRDRGDRWELVAPCLPQVHSVQFER